MTTGTASLDFAFVLDCEQAADGLVSSCTELLGLPATQMPKVENVQSEGDHRVFALAPDFHGKEGSVNDERDTLKEWQSRASSSLDWDEGFKSGRWDHLESLSETPRFGVVAGYLNKLVRRGTILDAGCGQGMLLGQLDLSRLNYVGFDISPNAISKIQTRSGCKLLVSSVEDFRNLEDELFAAVVFNEVLPQISEPLETLDRYMGMLENDGFAVVSLFQSPRPDAKGRILTRMLVHEIAGGRYSVFARAQVTDDYSQRTWNIWCLKLPQ